MYDDTDERPSRLGELRRQREMIAEHLAWLDRAIAEEEASRGTAPTPAAPPTEAGADPRPPSSAVLGESTAVESDADSVMSQFRVPTADLERDVRRGCLLYFVAALGVVAAIVALLYLALGG